MLVELENCALETCLEDIEVRVINTKSGKELTVRRIRELFEPNIGEFNIIVLTEIVTNKGCMGFNDGISNRNFYSDKR